MKLDDLIKRGKKLGLKSKNLSKKKKRDIMQELYRNDNRCICDWVFGHEAVWQIQSNKDEIVKEFEYYGKFDFYREGPKGKANMRECPICEMLYSDALPMA